MPNSPYDLPAFDLITDDSDSDSELVLDGFESYDSSSQHGSGTGSGASGSSSNLQLSTDTVKVG